MLKQTALAAQFIVTIWGICFAWHCVPNESDLVWWHIPLLLTSIFAFVGSFAVAAMHWDD